MSETISTGTDDLLAGLGNGVLTLTLNRPDARNAMSGAMTAALAAQLAEAELNPAVKVIVLTGAGKGFCAGGDVKGMAASGDGTVGDTPLMVQFIVSALISATRRVSCIACRSLR